MLVFAAALALATPSPQPSPTPRTIERVRVATGSPQSLHRLPVAASLLTAAQLHASPAMTGDAVLRGLPGFDRTRSNSGFTNYGQLRVSFSGAGTDRGAVFVDGIPAQDAFGGQIDWAAYPASDLERAELLRGPGSALYGSGAIGGVLSLQTFSPARRRMSGSISVGEGTHDASNNDVRAARALSPRISISLAASQQRLAYFDLPPAYQSPIDHAAQSQAAMLSLRARYAAGPHSALEYGYRGAWDYQQEGRPNYDFWRNFRQHSLAFTRVWPHASLHAHLYDRNTFVTNRADVSGAPGTLLYTQYVPSHESGAIAQWTTATVRSTFSARASARVVRGVSDQYNARNVFTAGGGGAQSLLDLALQNTWRFRRGEVVAGMAASQITDTLAARLDRALSPRVAMRYDLTRRVALRASAGTGFRAPYLNELVRGYVIGPVHYLPNANLVPERSSSFGAGLDYEHGVREVSFDVLRTFVNDAIEFTTLDATHQIRSNIAHTRTDGATVAYNQRLGACSSASVWATAQNPRVTAGPPATVGKALPYVPLFSASASYERPLGRASVGATVSYLGTTYADDLNLQPLGNAIVAGLRVGVPLSREIRLVFAADNLTNARYRSSIDRYGPPAVLSVSAVIPVRRSATRCP